MKRWVAAIVAALFLSTATMHSVVHQGDVDAACAVCHVQAASIAASAAPAIVAVEIPDIVLPQLAVPRAVSARVSSAPARAPPAVA